MAKRSVFSIFLIMMGFFSYAQYNVQSKYFVYLQTEPAQPFYIKINNQNISANSSGYLILPQLKDGDYKLTVGFPQNKYPEQTFDFRIDSKDKGYLIKNFGNEGWGLFDLQTMAVQKPVAAVDNAVAQAQPKAQPDDNVSDFTKVLSKAANDPSLLEKSKPEPVVEKPKPDPVAEKPVIKEAPEATPKPTDPAPPAKPVEEAVAVKEAPAIAPPPVEQKQVENTMPVSSTASTQGVTLIYEDKDETGKTESVTIFIPEPKKTYSNVTQPKAAKDAPEVVNQQPDKPEKFEVKEMPVIVEKPNVDETSTKVIKTNSECKSIADEDDFLKLRRKMAQRDNDDQMISEAQKAFKNKCYTTSQIKYLSSMFLSNAGKYNFYEAAYSHVADSENFATLASEIKDRYYIDKFNSLLNR